MLVTAVVSLGTVYFVVAAVLPGLVAALLSRRGARSVSFALNSLGAVTGAALAAGLMLAASNPDELDWNPFDLAAAYSVAVWFIGMSGAVVVGLGSWVVRQRVGVG